jgi:hypothetical protein
MRSEVGFLLVVMIVSTLTGTFAAEVTLSSASLSRQDLPDDFPFQLLYEGFAIIRITIENHSGEPLAFEVHDLQAYNRKGKEIRRARPTDIAPKLMKYHTGTKGIVSAEVYTGHPAGTYPGTVRRGPTINRDSRAPTVSANTGQKLRAHLEGYEIKDQVLEPGETLEGFYYLKSKRYGTKLAGGRVVWGTQTAPF